MRQSLLLILFLTIISAIAVYCNESNPHDLKGTDCVQCHELDLSGKVTGQDRITATCENCHRDLFAEGYMHPVDVVPVKVGIPRDFPLSRGGLITCNTCHDVHSSPETPFGTKSNYLRRYETGKAFCDACHNQTFAGTTRGHQAILGEAHFQSKYIVTDHSGNIDRMSRNCISCHDGAFASSVTINVGVWQHLGATTTNGMQSHPIGIDYEAARLKHGRKTDLRPIDMVDKRLLFFDGKVGCGTCHNPYSQVRKNLVLSNARSRLCLACHMVDR